MDQYSGLDNLDAELRQLLRPRFQCWILDAPSAFKDLPPISPNTYSLIEKLQFFRLCAPRLYRDPLFS